MAAKFAWGSAWNGRSYDLGRMSLGELWFAFLTAPAIDLYLLLALFCVGYTLAAAAALTLLLPVVAVVLLYPFVWYGLHRFFLHGRWLYRLRFTAALWKRVHFDHHQDPHRLEVLFGAPVTTIPTMVIVTVPLGYMVAAWSGAAAAFSTALLITCVYEFVHCIQHLNYKPKSRLVQRLKREHLLHHFHNENGNYGIVSFMPDRLLGSYYPTLRDMPKSATVFNLGYDLQEAKRYPWVMRLTAAAPRDKPPAATV
jgi:sterol desaturase/sphingolipid hydroxylase (fatty acid hydroxylase superfamily)